jgi:hypothetical protein
MSFSLSWRRVALACVLVMAVAAVLALRSSPNAEAQEQFSATFVFSSIPITASNGFASLGAGTGTNAGVLGSACTGAAPRSGTMIPGQVVTTLSSTATLMRIIRNDGAAITGTVFINCVMEFGSIGQGEAAADRLGVANAR